MKAFYKFLYTTLAGGIMFLIPLVVIIFVVRKAFEILNRLSAPFAGRFHEDIIFGFDGHNLFAAGVLVFVCFFAGLAFRARIVQQSVSRLENNVLSYMPGYLMLKSLATDTLGEVDKDAMKPVMVREENEFRFGFLVEEKDDWATVFIPDAPRMDAGEIKVVTSSSILPIHAKLQSFKHTISRYGRGGLSWLEEAQK